MNTFIESPSNLRQLPRLATFGIGLSALIVGAFHPATAAPDWDVGVSVLQATACYLLAGPAARNVVRAWTSRSLKPLLLAAAAAYICADLSYTLYWLVVNPQALALMAEAAIPANYGLFALTAMLWKPTDLREALTYRGAA